MTDHYSGSPIFPAEDPYATPQQQPGWTDAEQTAFLPPVPPQQEQQPQAWDAVQPPPSSSFSQIHEKYATTEVPLPPELLEPRQQPADASWPEHWTQPAQPQPAQHQAAQHQPVQAPPSAWQPQPQFGQPQQPQPQFAQPQQHGYAPAPHPSQPQPQASAEQTTLLPPVPPGGYAQPPQQPGYGLPPQFGPGQAASAEETAMLPPVPSGYAVPPQQGGYAPAPPAAQGPQYPQPQGGYAPAPPAAQGPQYPQPQGGFAPGPEAFAPGAEQLAPGATGWSDAPLGYAAAPSSLRETFAAAQPTGPAGSAMPPPPPPLEAQAAGGSLREAFAAAHPTGPFAGPHQPAPAAVPGTAAVRTGSPIIDPGIQPAAATLALAVLLALAALLGRFGLVLPVLLLQAVTAAGWFRLNGMWPARQGIALAALGGFAADAAALAASGGTAPAVLAGTLGGFFLLVLILQIFRPSNPDERFYALTVSASATVMTVLAGCFLAAGTLAHHGWSTGAAVVVGALAAGVATAASAVPGLPANIGFAAGGFAGVVAGTVLGAVTGLGLGGGLLLGLVAGACALVGRRVAAYDFPSRFVHLTAGVVLPLACAAPVTFLVGHLLAG